MLLLTFFDVNCFFPITIGFLLVWFFFFKFNEGFLNETQPINQELKKQSVIEKKANIFFIFICLTFICFLLFYFFTTKTKDQNFWWNHLYFADFNFNSFIFTISFSYFFFRIIKIFFFQSNFNSYDFLFSLINLINFLPLFFFINNLFFFFIYLELAAIFIFFLFIVARFWNNKQFSSWLKASLEKLRALNISYLNLLFFHFWSSFFSSVSLIFCILFFLGVFCSVEWSTINYFNYYYYYIVNNFSISSLIFIFCFLLFAIFLKMGFTPVHFFKLEIYKGLTYLGIYYYTTFYFLFFFLLIIFILLFYFFSFLFIWYFLIFIFISASFLFILHLLFDINYLKFFFAYSSIVNSLVFLFVLVSFTF